MINIFFLYVLKIYEFVSINNPSNKSLNQERKESNTSILHNDHYLDNHFVKMVLLLNNHKYIVLIHIYLVMGQSEVQ